MGVGVACHPAAFEQVSKKGCFEINAPVASREQCLGQECPGVSLQETKAGTDRGAGIIPLTEHLSQRCFWKHRDQITKPFSASQLHS